MTTVLLTEQGASDIVSFRRYGPRQRLEARLRAWTLDAALARGACPDSSVVLSLRARTLISRRMRHQLSRRLRHVLSLAQRPSRPPHWTVPVCRREVTRARAEVEALADRLISPDPVEATGVARVKMLVSDGSSPMYYRPRAAELEQALLEAIEALEPEL